MKAHSDNVTGRIVQSVMCALLALGVAGCSNPESWTPEDRQSLAKVAGAVARGVGDVSYQAFDQSAGITASGAYAVVTISLRQPSGQAEPAVRVFSRSLADLGYPMDFKSDCIEPEAGTTKCHGTYGDVVLDDSTITWSNYRGFFVEAAARLST